ncbi:hypothetical protein DL89DRAFT_269349 [Linderina pennispora]|uniref:Elongation of fatty acids protein n=1 Tax=Linderina pennispora TaxID=61395 RepID=A0A1Y1W277_9FUNG|nr:uncharacterized protein DL89DRAFT_269349 [Linderina pennispora]ORX67552.1 hypothetical protein DL89DRAFT_269349 [Linderina pennispora]
MGVTLGSGTTVDLENIPLRQFHNLSIHPATPVVIVVSYIAIVQWLNGSRSKSLSPSRGQTPRLLSLHNVLLAGFSYWCATNYTSFFANVVDQESLKEAYCDSNLTIWNNMYKFNYLFYLSKYYELIDTFIILAKGRKATLLQTYHHAGAITTMWLGCYFGSPQLIFFYLTHLQIGQFLLGLVFIALYITLPNCLTPLQKNLIYVMLSYLIPLLYLFVDFSIKTYGRKKKTKTL